MSIESCTSQSCGPRNKYLIRLLQGRSTKGRTNGRLSLSSADVSISVGTLRLTELQVLRSRLLKSNAQMNLVVFLICALIDPRSTPLVSWRTFQAIHKTFRVSHYWHVKERKTYCAQGSEGGVRVEQDSRVTHRRARTGVVGATGVNFKSR